MGVAMRACSACLFGMCWPRDMRGVHGVVNCHGRGSSVSSLLPPLPFLPPLTSLLSFSSLLSPPSSLCPPSSHPLLPPLALPSHLPSRLSPGISAGSSAPRSGGTEPGKSLVLSLCHSPRLGHTRGAVTAPALLYRRELLLCSLHLSLHHPCLLLCSPLQFLSSLSIPSYWLFSFPLSLPCCRACQGQRRARRVVSARRNRLPVPPEIGAAAELKRPRVDHRGLHRAAGG